MEGEDGTKLRMTDGKFKKEGDFPPETVTTLLTNYTPIYNKKLKKKKKVSRFPNSVPSECSKRIDAPDLRRKLEVCYLERKNRGSLDWKCTRHIWGWGPHVENRENKF